MTELERGRSFNSMVIPRCEQPHRVPMKQISLLLVSCVALFCFTRTTFAQTPAPENDTQLWTDVQLQHWLNKKKTVDLIFTGTFRLGRNLSHPVDERAGLGFAFKLGKYLTFTPSYLYIATQPSVGRKGYENRLTADGTVKFNLGEYTFIDRNLVERRLRNSQADSTRYRNRLRIERPAKLSSKEYRFFIADEVFYDWSVNEWVRNRFSVGANTVFKTRYTGELYYLRQNDGRSRPGDLHVIGTSLKIRL